MKYAHTIKLIFMGIASSFCFSFTFFLNKIISINKGYWVWNGVSRYCAMIIMILLIIYFTKGAARLKYLFRLYSKNFIFFSIAGSIGYGGFYALICFSANYLDGWLVAGIWQLTIVFTPVVLLFFGHKIRPIQLIFVLLALPGIYFISQSQFKLTGHFQWGIPAVIIAGLFYPVGNQLLWEACKKKKLMVCLKNQALPQSRRFYCYPWAVYSSGLVLLSSTL